MAQPLTWGFKEACGAGTPGFQALALVLLLCRNHQSRKQYAAERARRGSLVGRFPAHAGERNSVWSSRFWLPADADGLVSSSPFVAEGDPVFSTNQMVLKTSVRPHLPGPSVGCPQASACPYVLRGACCTQSLSPFTVLFLCLRGCKMLLLEKPLDWLCPGWAALPSLLPGILQ